MHKSAEPGMHIVLAMAGHSRRFKEAGFAGPKAFLDIDGRPMVSHVVDLFNGQASFHFIISQQQVQERPSIVEDLKALASQSHVYVISPHEKGPVFSALQATNIPDNAEVIVSYCDFSVDWDYEQFLRHARTADLAIPSFRGFQPASFGDTYYAYMRVDGDRVLELREKRSFTETRHEEPASAGIYYFSSQAIFKKYAEKLLAEPAKELPEAYVSLLANPMIADGLKVVIHEVERFICWGTPHDYNQYLFWLDHYKKSLAQSHSMEKKDEVLRGTGVTRVNLIPMAGRGARFQQEGYRAPKPFIEVQGIPMVLKSALSLPPAEQWVFVAQRQDLKRYPIRRELKRHLGDCRFVALDGTTTGQAATCLTAEDLVAPDAQLMIHSCDYMVWFDPVRWQRMLEDEGIDAALWTVRLGSQLTKNPNAFAYCRTTPPAQGAESTAVVTEIVEKKTISATPQNDPMAMGSFWFRRASDFFTAAKLMMRKGTKVNGEHYVATAMNELIAQGKRVVSFPIDQWISFGDPFELHVFEFWNEHFKAKGTQGYQGAQPVELRIP